MNTAGRSRRPRPARPEGLTTSRGAAVTGEEPRLQDRPDEYDSTTETLRPRQLATSGKVVHVAHRASQQFRDLSDRHDVAACEAAPSRVRVPRPLRLGRVRVGQRAHAATRPMEPPTIPGGWNRTGLRLPRRGVLTRTAAPVSSRSAIPVRACFSVTPHQAAANVRANANG